MTPYQAKDPDLERIAPSNTNSIDYLDSATPLVKYLNHLQSVLQPFSKTSGFSTTVLPRRGRSIKASKTSKSIQRRKITEVFLLATPLLPFSPTSTPESTTVSPLHKLPQEIREIIWEYSFTESSGGILPLQRALCASNKSLSAEVIETYRKRNVFHLSSHNISLIQDERETPRELLKSVRYLCIYTGGSDRPAYIGPRRAIDPVNRYLGDHLTLSSFLGVQCPFPSLTTLTIRVLSPVTKFSIAMTLHRVIINCPALIRLELEFSVLDRFMQRKFLMHQHHRKEECETTRKLKGVKIPVLEEARMSFGKESRLRLEGRMPYRVGRAVWQAEPRTLLKNKKIERRRKTVRADFRCGCKLCMVGEEREWEGCCSVKECNWCRGERRRARPSSICRRRYFSR